ncbi:unnamed protein product, partial [Allacma fusca]
SAKISGSPFYKFKRHLELIHPEEFGSEEPLAGASSKLSGNYSPITDLFAKCK